MSSSPEANPPLPRWKRITTWVVRALIVLFVWATLVEPQMVIRQDHAFSPSPSHASQWPQGCQGLRVAVVSDFHVGDFHLHPWRLDYIHNQVAKSKPDLIVVPGDFAAHVMGGRTLPMDQIADRLRDWPSVAPVVAVLGNHDYSDAPKHIVIEGLEKHGIDVLDNESKQVSLRGGTCEFWLAGVGDGFSGLDSLPAAMEFVPESAPTVLISHDPRVATKIENPSRVSLVLAGHTHGGVACVPFTHVCLSRVHPWTGGWVRGWYHSTTHPPVLVSSGLGNSIYPGRVGSPPGWDLVVWR